MQTLASALSRLAPKRTPLELCGFDPRDPLDPVCELIETLQQLPPTPQIEAELAAHDRHLSLLPDPTPDGDVAADERAKVASERRKVIALLDKLRRRDQLATGRPDGCWCLGLGGRKPAATFAKLPDCDGLEWSECPAVYRVTCEECPEGQAAEARRALAEDYARTTGVLDLHARMLGQAEVPTLYSRCTLENYPRTPESTPAWEKLVDYDRRLETNLPGKRSVWLWGETLGAGKTSLACALLGRWAKRNPIHRGLFVTIIDLLDAIRSARETGVSARRLMEDAQERGFAVIDDLGSELDSPWVAEKLFAVINGRHNNMLPTIFTSNLGPADLDVQLGGDSPQQRRQAARIVARLTEMCEVVHLCGPDLRDVTVRARLGLPPEPGAPGEALPLPF